MTEPFFKVQRGHGFLGYVPGLKYVLGHKMRLQSLAKPTVSPKAKATLVATVTTGASLTMIYVRGKRSAKSGCGGDN